MNITVCRQLLQQLHRDGVAMVQNESLVKTEDVNGNNRPLTNETYTVISAVLLLILLAGIIENGAVVFVFLIKQTLRNTTNSLVTFLCLCNFLISTLAIPFVAASALAKKWIFGYAGCEFHGFIVTGVGLTQIAVLVVISVDRYITIVKSGKTKIKTVKCYTLVISGCVLYGFILAVFPLFGGNSYKLEVAGISCATDWNDGTIQGISYSVLLLVLGLCIPLVVMSMAYYSIIRKITEQRLQSVINKTGPEGKRLLKRESKVATTVLLLIIAFIVSWLPYSVFSIASLVGVTDNTPIILATLPSFFAKSSVIWNPIIYIYRNKKFRSALIETFPCLNICSTIGVKCSHDFTKLNQTGPETSFPLQSVDNKDSSCISSGRRNSWPRDKETQFALTKITSGGSSITDK